MKKILHCPGDGLFWWSKRASSWQQYTFRYWLLQFWRPNNDVSLCNAGLELLQRSESATYNPKDCLKPKDYRIHTAFSKRFVLQLMHGVCFVWKLLVFFLLACKEILLACSDKDNLIVANRNMAEYRVFPVCMNASLKQTGKQAFQLEGNL